MVPSGAVWQELKIPAFKGFIPENLLSVANAGHYYLLVKGKVNKIKEKILEYQLDVSDENLYWRETNLLGSSLTWRFTTNGQLFLAKKINGKIVLEIRDFDNLNHVVGTKVLPGIRDVLDLDYADGQLLILGQKNKNWAVFSYDLLNKNVKLVVDLTTQPAGKRFGLILSDFNHDGATEMSAIRWSAGSYPFYTLLGQKKGEVNIPSLNL
jgi:hypothetical protein